MELTELNKVFTQDYLDTLLPNTISDQFFEALYGDASDGAYDISLEYISASDKRIVLAFSLTQRPDKCLACNLTYGLPNVFLRHPLINIKGMVTKIEKKGVKIKSWSLGQTKEKSSSLHLVPFFIELE